MTSERWKRVIADDFLESSAATFAAPYIAGEFTGPVPGDDSGAIVGRYRLIREIGRGGMGSVWLAERADGQFEQQVALKLVRRGMDSDEILARFLSERQILAGLEHPNIARLLDGGVSDGGRPYFVMEHVAGTPITAFCDERRLDVATRLRLFIVTCRAIQHAHQNLVVHLDIKPSNVLVTESGVVKLLDFGVAKLLRENKEETASTRTGHLTHALTPEYASPEQLAGEPVTTTSDVFQLGVLLYQLLTGRRPVRSARDTRATQPPSMPSAVVTRVERVSLRNGDVETIDPHVVGERRSITPHQLQKRLRGDLDSITARALHNEPSGRYPSAQTLAEDVDRHLRHLPIRFGGDARSYRAGKFIRRHRLRFSAALLLGVASLAVVSAYLVQIRSERDRAVLEAEKASASAARLSRFFQAWSPDAADRGKVSTATVLADATLRAQHELGGNPEMLAAALSELGDLYGGLGLVATADSLLLRALTMQEKLHREPSADVAATLARRGRLLALRGRVQEAEVVLRRALVTYRTVFPPGKAEVLRTQHELADALLGQEKLAEAEALLRDALEKSPDAEAPLTTELAAMLGYVLFRQARYAEASTILRPSLERQRRIFGRFHQATLRTTRSLASSLRDRRSLVEAEGLSREALDIARALYGDNHVHTHYSTMALAVLLERKGDFADAEAVARTAVEQGERLFGEANINTALTLRTLGGVLLAQDRQRDAESVLRRARAALRRTFPEGHPDEGDVVNRLAYILLARGAPDAASVYRQAVEFERARASSAPFFVTDGYEYLGWAARRMRDAPMAELLYRRAVRLYEAELPDGHPYRAQSNVGLGQLLLETGRSADAEPFLRAGLGQWNVSQPSQPERVSEVMRLLASMTHH